MTKGCFPLIRYTYTRRYTCETQVRTHSKRTHPSIEERVTRERCAVAVPKRAHYVGVRVRAYACARVCVCARVRVRVLACEIV